MTPHLASIPQWLPVLLAPRADGRTDKIPFYVATAMPCDAHQPAHWTTYVAALAAAQAWGPQFTVGFVITANDDVFCVDVDGALQADGTWSLLSQQLVAALPGCMVEISQSGRGLHIWGRYPNPPPHRMKNIPLHIECYTELRFIAIGTNQTGDIAPRCDGFPAVLAQYFGKSKNIYKCPADIYVSTPQRNLGWTSRCRSVSGNIYIGEGNGWTSGPGYTVGGPNNLTIYKGAKKAADLLIPGPTQTWVYMDEHPDSINDAGAFAPNTKSNIPDAPATYHNGAADFAMADGHSEIHKWKDARTAAASKRLPVPLSTASSPATRCSSVLFPAPEGPMIAMRSPVQTVRLTLLSTSVTVPLLAYALHRS